jgi:Bacterial Ig domain
MSLLGRIDGARRARRNNKSRRDRTWRQRRFAITPDVFRLLEERCLLSVYTVTDPSDGGGSGTLRSIIGQVNSDSSPDTVDFSLPGSAPFVIQLTSALPQVTNSVVIDGTSQPGYAGQPIVELNGNQAGGGSNGLQLEVGNVTIEGLIIDQFNGNGIQIDQGDDDLIQGNYIGTDSTGSQPAGNNGDGITLGTTSNDTIGGTTAQTRNIISANGAKGIHFIFGTNTGIVVLGNYIGTDVNGSQKLGNNANGIDFFANASGNTIGGMASGAGNVIANNNGQGIEIFGGGSPNNTIVGNLIGTDATGTVAMGNNGWGVDTGSSGTLVLNNVISDNNSGGVHPQAQGIIIQGNDICTDVTGTQPLGNQGPGVDASSSDVEIGGLSSGQGNVIAFNGLFGQPGVIVENGSTGVSIENNSIFSNGGLGIDLGNDGVTMNHPGGSNFGPNNYQNFPVLSHALTFGGSTVVIGTLNSAANSTFTVQFFDNPTADPSGYGEGETLIGTTTVNTDSSGNASFSPSFPALVNAGDAISATATDSSGDTSEFAQDVTAVALSSPLQAVNDSYNTDENTTLSVAAPGVQANDFSVFGGSFTSVQDSSPIHGTLTFNSDGSFTYVPNKNFIGTDSFTYEDMQGSVTSNVATVAIAVNSKTLTVTNTNDSGPGSLRAALTAAAASNSPGADTVLFKIPGSGPFVISPGSELPAVARPTIINGYSQAGSHTNSLSTGDNAVIQIEIDGSNSGGANGLVLTGGGSTVEGLSITRFDDAILISGSGGNTITGNFLGTNPTGTAGGYANQTGLEVQTSGNVLGGPKAAARNVISGNNNQGVLLDDGASGNVVAGNYIGTDVSGSNRLSNNGGGVVLDDAPQNTIGGSGSGAGNLISGNGNNGVLVSSSNNGPGSLSTVIQGNTIGLNASGVVALGNNNNGVEIDYGSGTLIGGPAAADANVISGNQAGVFLQNSAIGVAIEGNDIGTDPRGFKAIGNQFDGVVLSGAQNTVGGVAKGERNVISGNGRDGISDGVYAGSIGFNTIFGNLIGTDSTGTVALGNNQDGIELGTLGDVVGGTTAATQNVISGNNQYGLVIERSSTGILVEGNDIGTDSTGKQPLGNGAGGVQIQDNAFNNSIGGAAAKAGNIIAFNGGTGVVVKDQAVSNPILTDSIFANSNQGIVLLGNGNNLQVAPVLSSASSSGSGTSVLGTLTAAPNATYQIQFFANPAADPSGSGQGQTYLATKSVTTNGSGMVSFSITIKPALSAGEVVSATATSPSKNTSAFSADVAVTGLAAAVAAPPIVVSARLAPVAPAPTVSLVLAASSTQDDSVLTALAVDQVRAKKHVAISRSSHLPKRVAKIQSRHPQLATIRIRPRSTATAKPAKPKIEISKKI